MKIGILTGGGDVPGLNAAIKAVVTRAASEGHEVLGIRRGWGGFLHTNPDDPATAAANTVVLDPGVVRTIDRTGGTFLHTSRTNPAKVARRRRAGVPRGGARDDGPRDHTAHAVRVVRATWASTPCIPIGGDDTLSFALRHAPTRASP